MSLSATLFGRDSAIFKATNILGLGIPGWLDKTFGAKPLQGASLGEMASQTSKEGVARPIIWGIVRPIGGNIIATSEPIIRQIESETDSGGKGGGSKSKKTMVDAVYRTYAIRICEGPITGIRRVWRNTKLVYDGRGNAWGATNNGVFLTKATFYLGGWDQLPSPALQSIFGVAAVTAHRGTCYMTMSDEDLTDLGGAIPQFIFEVERAEGMPVTSKLYPVVESEGMGVGVGVSDLLVKEPLHLTDDIGAMTASASVYSVVLSDLLHNTAILEAMDIVVTVPSVALTDIVRATANLEAMDVVVIVPSITLIVTVVTTKLDAEALDVNASVTSILLT